MHFDLLQFQFDRSIYKVVSEWSNQHCALCQLLACSCLSHQTFLSNLLAMGTSLLILDAVDQFGLPDVFVTISPFECSFPFPNWFEAIRAQTGKIPTQLSAF